MKRPTPVILLLATALLAASCLQQQQQKAGQDEQKKSEATPQALPPLHLGAVHQVYPEQGFALLRIIGPMPKPGDTLITHPANGSTERIGNLSISVQQPSRGDIIAADIRSGTVVKGDRVFRYRNISQPPSDDVIAVERPAGMPDEEATKPETQAADHDAGLSPEDFDAFVNTPALEEGEAPAPLSTDTTVLPVSVPAAPGSAPGAPSAPTKAPDYLNSIPDSIDGWDDL